MISHIEEDFETLDYWDTDGLERIIDCTKTPEMVFDSDRELNVPRGYPELEVFLRNGKVLVPNRRLANLMEDPFSAHPIYSAGLVAVNETDKQLFESNSNTGFNVQLLSLKKTTTEEGIEKREKIRPLESFSTQFGVGLKGVLPLIDPNFLKRELGFSNPHTIRENEFRDIALTYLDNKSKEMGMRVTVPLIIHQVATTENVSTQEAPFKLLSKEQIIIKVHSHFDYVNMSDIGKNYIQSLSNLGLKNDPRDLISLLDIIHMVGIPDRFEDIGIEAGYGYGIFRVSSTGKVLGEPHLVDHWNWTSGTFEQLRNYASRAIDERRFALSDPERQGDIEGLENIEIAVKVIDDNTVPASKFDFVVASSDR